MHRFTKRSLNLDQRWTTKQINKRTKINMHLVAVRNKLNQMTTYILNKQPLMDKQTKQYASQKNMHLVAVPVSDKSNHMTTSTM